jgi:hypothetical protein
MRHSSGNWRRDCNMPDAADILLVMQSNLMRLKARRDAESDRLKILTLDVEIALYESSIKRIERLISEMSNA